MTVKDTAIKYCDDILNNKIVSCKATKQACKRFLDNLNDDRYYFDEDTCSLLIRFASSLKHFTGQFNNQTFELSNWQVFFVANIYGLKVRGTGRRKYTSVYLQIARKNGKTSLISLLAIFELLFGDADGNILILANAVEQARNNLDITQKYCSSIDKQRKYLIPQFSKIKYKGSKIQIKSSDSSRLDGMNNNMVIIDELHAAAQAQQTIDVCRSGMAARTEPLLIIITTSGTDITKYCHHLYTTYKQMLNGDTEMDEKQFVLIYELEDEDIQNDEFMNDPNCWIKANPNIDISCYSDFLQSEIDAAKVDRTKRLGLLQKNFDCWLDGTIVNSQDEKYIDDEVVLKNMVDVDLKNFNGCWCFASVDLSSVSDLNVLTLMIPRNGYFYFKNFFYLPEQNNNIKDVKSQINVWNKEGYINLTPGNCLDSNYIVNDLKKIVDNYNINIIELHLDVYNSTSFQLKMVEDLADIPVIPYQQSFLNFNKSTKELKMLMLREQCRIDKNAVTRWNFHNSIIKETTQGNQKCMKLNGNKSNKIDSVISMQMALGGYLTSNYCYSMN